MEDAILITPEAYNRLLQNHRVAKCKNHRQEKDYNSVAYFF